ncbi:hypothetical protein HK105_208249 [Polyrhizophydium stewartii]|uniref:Ankyrin repeat protein n=1 Tax=Polyrhizophydium stewartii TaxID=2732419 RepID=A0ABR4MYF4_9FUNG
MADIRTNDAPAAALAAPPPAAQPAAAHADPAAATAQHDRLAERLDGQPAPPAVSPPLAAAPASTTSQPPPSTTSDAPRAVRFRPYATNEWDRMPAEIQNKILAHAGVLTLWVNGRINISGINLKQLKGMLRDVFELDWQGDLATLPLPKFNLDRLSDSFWRLRSRSMHARFKALDISGLNNVLDQAAILNGWTDLLDLGEPAHLAENSARCGSIEMLQHLVDKREAIILDSNHAILAVTYGHLDLLKWLHERMPDGSWMPDIMNHAAWRGHLDLVKWLHSNRREGCSTRAMDWAACDGHLHVVKWLHENRAEGCTTQAMDLAALGGHLEVVEFLHINRTEGCTTRAMNDAAGHGHADVVEFLHRNRSEASIVVAAQAAASHGQLSVIQRVHTLAPDVITPAISNLAAAGGRSRILDWMADNTSARPTAEGVTRAVKRRNLPVLHWFRQRMPEIFYAHPASKVDGQNADVVIDWFCRDDLPGDIRDVMQLAIQERQVVVVKWLLRHPVNVKWHDGDIELARKLIDNTRAPLVPHQ